MVAIIGLVLLGIIAIWFFVSYRQGHQKSLNLNYYIVYLLLNDSIRQSHKQKFEMWIRDAEAKDAISLSLKAYEAIEGIADELADGELSSAVRSHGMICNYKKETGTR